jgi:hypothetical protein
MKMYGEVQAQLHLSPALVLEMDQQSASCPRYFIHGESSMYPLDRMLSGPDSLHACREEAENLSAYQKLHPYSLAIQPKAQSLF